MNKKLYGNQIELPEEVKTYLGQCFDVASNANDSTEGYKRNKELRDSGFVTYQQLKRMKNWFDNFGGTENDLPFILNGAHYMKDWVNKTLDSMRNKSKESEYTQDIKLSHNDVKVNSMNRPSKSHHKHGLDYESKIVEHLRRINQIMKTII